MDKIGINPITISEVNILHEFRFAILYGSAEGQNTITGRTNEGAYNICGKT